MSDSPKNEEWRQHFFDASRYPRLHEVFRRARGAFWDLPEVTQDISTDVKHWTDKLVSAERRFQSIILAYFATADSIINDDIAGSIIPLCSVQVSRSFLRFQVLIEDLHAETYAFFLNSYPIPNREELKAGMTDIPAIAAKIEWYRSWMRKAREESDDIQKLRKLLVIQVCAEMIQFSASLVGAVEPSYKRGLLPALGAAISLIVRDEGLHGEHAIRLLEVVGHPDQAWIQEVFRDCIRVEDQYSEYLLLEPITGMTATQMKQYNHYVADRALVMMGQPKIWNATNPFEWMVAIGSASKSSIHERFPTEYQTLTKAALDEDPFADL